jgi:hypothetical protein
VSVPKSPRAPGRAAGIRAKTLRIDWGTAEVLRSFQSAGVQALLLKGATFAHWLYSADDPRPYGDCDLLVRPGDFDRAREALAGLGFEPTLDEAQMPEWWREHAVAWLRHSDALTVDLHHTLEGVGVDDDALWRTLVANHDTVEVAGYPAPALTITGRAVHLVLHAAQHGSDWAPLLDEVERAIRTVDAGTWTAAGALAAELEATPAFAAGLRLVPSGRELADRLKLPSARSVGVELRTTTPPPGALVFDQLSQATGFRARLRILRHKLFPPATFMRKWSPRARRGRLGLAVAYAERPIWLLKQAPAGFRAWRAARRAQPPGA